MDATNLSRAVLIVAIACIFSLALAADGDATVGGRSVGSSLIRRSLQSVITQGPEREDVPLSRRAFREQFGNSDFTFDFNEAQVLTNGEGGGIRGATPVQWPALSGHGFSQTVTDIAPCSINTPHLHPRATEMLYITKGRLIVGFAEENGGRIVTNDIKEGNSAFFPHTLIHWQFNPTCEPAQFVGTLNSDDGGVHTIAQALFGLPNDVLATALNVDEYDVTLLHDELPNVPALGLKRDQCRRKCGL
ncbi:unnamed protein product [Vitrella brassicaformis CCMP3155]|uniref:Cupin type-1 domain-containing protein n=2 Tax=Vitrella brassicaformis TaxID=1169539 RepID=A0A0G4EG82_VITBC|nr:unnamed protein product [Vitrella brassicaformis CCMP3155]|mmetsp:Transcript_51834/g.130177  ORF Transcript_51834/g.130177 Transcript_51834/m.130177 type:complete len:247 (+) Transcript_51834:342-1082(+)|eukprot:CEL94495.1 unnamed protein product [Vitrella brassicaformis CCMP3155]